MFERTVDGALEALAADFALQRADAGLLIDLNGYGVLVIAEEAGEDGGERVALGSRGRATLAGAQTNEDGRARVPTYPLLALGRAGALLALSHVSSGCELIRGWMVQNRVQECAAVEVGFCREGWRNLEKLAEIENAITGSTRRF